MKILCVGFTKTHVDICRLNNPKSPNIHMKASYLHLEFGRPPSEANNEAPRPEIHRYSAAEAPCRLRFAPPATPPPPGASPPPRGLLQLRSATESSLRHPMRQRHFSLKWRKSHNRNPLGSNEVHQTVTDRRGPGPLFICTSTCALAVRSSWTTSAWLRLAAVCSGVTPQSGARPVEGVRQPECTITSNVHPGIYP